MAKITHRNGLIACYALASLALLFFLFAANPVGLFFLNDDFVHVPLAAAGNFLHSNLLRPVSDCSLWIDYQVWAKNAFGFHLTNVFLHLLNTVLVYLLLLAFSKNRVNGKQAALLAATFFLVYAFHSESIFWIIGRGGSLAGLFILISLNCYERSKSTSSLIVALISFAVGLFAYESCWILPVIIVIFQGWDFFNNRPSPFKWSISFWVLFIVYLLVRSAMDTVHVSQYEIGALKGWHLSKLSVNYFATIARCFLPPTGSSRVFLLLVLFIGVIMTGALIFIAKTRSAVIAYLVLPLLLFLVACLPTIGLGIDTHDSEGERFLYVPSIFLCWFVTELLFALFQTKAVRLAAMTALLLFHCFFLYRSAKDYRYASGVVRHSLECLSVAPSADTLVTVSLPSQYRGALIFRTGFENAVKWWMPGKFADVQVISSKEILKPVLFWCVPVPSGVHRKTLHMQWSGDGHVYFSDAIR